MSRALFATLLVSASVWAGTPKYPFPTTMNYPFGKNFVPQDFDADVQETYDEFVSLYYSTCSDGSARIHRMLNFSRSHCEMTDIVVS